MIAVIDTTLLLLLIDRDAPSRTKDAKARLEHLLDTLEEKSATVIVPAPAYAELLIRAPSDIAAAFKSIEGTGNFRIAPFDKRAAIECAIMLAKVWGKGQPKSGGASSRNKIKFDHQIVAIAKVQSADVVYSDDDDVLSLCEREKIKAESSKDLPLPADSVQGKLFESGDW